MSLWHFKVLPELLDAVFKLCTVTLGTNNLINALGILTTQIQGYLLGKKCSSYAFTIIYKKRYSPFIQIDAQHIRTFQIMDSSNNHTGCLNILTAARIGPTKRKVLLHQFLSFLHYPTLVVLATYLVTIHFNVGNIEKIMREGCLVGHVVLELATDGGKYVLLYRGNIVLAKSNVIRLNGHQFSFLVHASV